MEVNNPMMDQLLVNTAPQPAPKANANATKEADGQDFDSMVHQKRTADAKPKSDAKDAKAADTVQSKDAPEAEEPVTDEQYAIAAAMMFQAQPDARYTVVPSENAEPLPEQTAPVAEQPVQPLEPETPLETPEVQPEALAGPETEVRSAAAEAPREKAAPEQNAAQTEEAPAPKAEAREAQIRPVRTERRDEPAEPRTEEPTRVSTNETRTVRPTAQAARTEDDAQEDADANAEESLGAQEAPLFERVDTSLVKVAEVSKPIPLEAEDGVEQLGEELGGVLVNHADANRVELTLTPEHLGRLTVEISRSANGAISVVLHTSSERAANLLERGSANLQNLLAANTKNDVQVEVRPAEEPQQQFLNPDGQNRQNQEQQQQQNGRRREQQGSAQDFLQQLRLGLVDVEDGE